MNCSEAQQLFDAYLDGQLAGSLRLEFDAHRLRCSRCQQTLAMMEAVGHVIATDPDVPSLSDDFTDKVMQRVAKPRPRIYRLITGRVAIGLQAAAVLAFVLLWHNWSDSPTEPTVAPTAGVASAHADDPEYREVMGALVRRVEDRLWDVHAAGRQLTSDMSELASYLNVPLPAEVADESVKMAGSNPLLLLFDSLLPPEEQPENEPADDVGDVHSI